MFCVFVVCSMMVIDCCGGLPIGAIGFTMPLSVLHVMMAWCCELRYPMAFFATCLVCGLVFLVEGDPVFGV
jgi:hypothetical protein